MAHWLAIRSPSQPVAGQSKVTCGLREWPPTLRARRTMRHAREPLHCIAGQTLALSAHRTHQTPNPVAPTAHTQNRPSRFFSFYYPADHSIPSHLTTDRTTSWPWWRSGGRSSPAGCVKRKPRASSSSSRLAAPAASCFCRIWELTPH